MFCCVGAFEDDKDDRPAIDEEELKAAEDAEKAAQEQRKEKHRKREEEREEMRQKIRDKVKNANFCGLVKC